VYKFPLIIFFPNNYYCIHFVYLKIGLWVWLILLPTLIVNSKQYDTDWCVTDILGWSLWLLGMWLECIADYQKYKFRGVSANKYVCVLT